MKNIRIVAFVIALALAPTSHAIEVFLTGPTQVGVGAQFEIGFWIDIANDPIIGGGVDLFYDPLLTGFAGFSFNPALACVPLPNCSANQLDPLFSFGPSDDGLGTLSFLTFGNFNGIASPAPLLIGTLTFDALAMGLADFSLDPDTPAGWVSDVFPYSAIDAALIDSTGWSVNIVAAVPEPSVLLLLSGGVLLMAGIRRNRHR